MRSSSAKRTVFVCLTLLALLGGLLAWLRSSGTGGAKITLTEAFTDDQFGVSVRYPASFIRREIGEQQAKVGYKLRIDQVEPPAFFFLKVERGGRGLGTVSALGGVSRLEILRRNSERTLPTLYQGYEPVKTEEIKLGELDGFVFTFTYDGPSGKRVKQRFTEVLRDGSLIYSFISQAQLEQFDALLPTFQAIEASVEFRTIQHAPAAEDLPLPSIDSLKDQ